MQPELVLDPTTASNEGSHGSVAQTELRNTHSAIQVTSVDTLLAAITVLSILLAPLRLGDYEALRPMAMVFLPCAFCLAWRNVGTLVSFLQSRQGYQIVGLFVLLSVGHFLGNDWISGFQGEDYSILSLENLLVMPVVLACGMILGSKSSCRFGLCVGLGMGLVFHLISVGIVQSATSYRSFDRASGVLADPNILLLYVVPVFFLWRGLLVKPLWRWIALLLIVPVVWATLQTLSRAGLIALASGLLALLLASLIFSRTARERRAALVTVIAIPLLLVVLMWRKPDFVEERVAAYTTRTTERIAESGSFLNDRLMWLNELETHRLSDHVLHPFGMGYNLFQEGNEILPHNTFVDVYIIAGPLAFVFYLLLFSRAIRNSFLAAFRTARPADSFSSLHLFAFMLTMSLLLFSLSVLTWKVNWLLLGIALSRFGSSESTGTQEA